MKFSEAIRSARLERAETQEAASLAVEVSQSRYSQWENGRSLRSINEQVVKKISDHLGLESATLTDALRHEVRSLGDPLVDAYEEAHEFLKEADFKIEMWTLGTAQLRVADQSSAGDLSRRRWVEYLTLGAKIHFIWLLDQAEPETLYRLAASFTKLGLLLQEAGHVNVEGRIEHHALTLKQLSEGAAPEASRKATSSPFDARLPRNREIYREIMEQHLQWNLVHEILEIDDIKLWRDLQLYNVSFASTILYVPSAGSSTVPEAQVVCRDVLNRRSDTSPSPKLFWLPRKAVDEVLGVIYRFKEAERAAPTKAQFPMIV